MLVHSVILSIGGIPLIYAGDELGLTNDYSYEHDDSKKADQRWVHRIEVSDEDIKKSPNEEISTALSELFEIRAQNPIFGQSQTHYLDAPNQHCFAYLRVAEGNRCLCISNFSEHTLDIEAHHMGVLGSSLALNLVTNDTVDCRNTLTLAPYQFVWLFAS